MKVNALAPGLTSTPMTEKEMQMPGLREAFVKEYPLGRIGTAEDVADAAALARPARRASSPARCCRSTAGSPCAAIRSPRDINASLAAAKSAPA